MSRPHPILAALARIRVSCNRAQVTVATAIYVPQTAISLWESGKRDPRLSQVEAYAREFGLRLALVPLESSNDRKEGG